MSHLHDRVIEISKNHGLSHNGSCLTSVSIIDEIYSLKKEEDPFILSCGHAFLALAVVLEKNYGYNAEELYLKHGTHPNRDMENKIWCSTGSLGHGLGISLGMALADKTKNVYCLISDGESYEGIVYETGNAMHRYGVGNLKVYINWNGLSAYDTVDINHISRLEKIIPGLVVKQTYVEDYGLNGLSAHYAKL